MQENPNVAFHLLRLCTLLRGHLEETQQSAVLQALAQLAESDSTHFVGRSSAQRFRKEFAALAALSTAAAEGAVPAEAPARPAAPAPDILAHID